MTNQPHPHTHEVWRELSEDFIDRLEQEARINAPARDEIIDQVSVTLDTPPKHIIDLGSGIGSDTVALAARFPNARVIALDVSTQLRDRVAAAAVAAGVERRVEARDADLNGEWASTIPKSIDLAWASLSLHHLSDPAQALHQIFTSLRPGGMLVLTELTARSHENWAKLLGEAGFDLQDQQEYEATGGELEHTPGTANRTVWIATRLDRADAQAAPASLPPGTTPQSIGTFEAEVVVVGGGSAGLAAAIALARSRRTVVVIDGGEPRNAPATGAHNVLGQEGISPLELLSRGRSEAESYGVRILPGNATGITGTINDFTVEIGGGAHRVHAQRIILATGLIDDLPSIPGVREGWGRTVLHCPFCHGWEVRDQRIAILTRGEIALHQAVLFGQLSDQVTLYLHDAPDPTAEQTAQLSALNVSVIRPQVRRLVMEGAQVRGVELEDGQIVQADAAVVVPKFNANTELYESLGGQPEFTAFGTQIPTDPRGMTDVAGVWAAGNAAQPMAMVVASAAAGVSVGAAVHGELSMVNLAQAVQERRVLSA